jgi:hypothetical protein
MPIENEFDKPIIVYRSLEETGLSPEEIEEIKSVKVFIESLNIPEEDEDGFFFARVVNVYLEKVSEIQKAIDNAEKRSEMEEVRRLKENCLPEVIFLASKRVMMELGYIDPDTFELLKSVY